ncbi:hypothetical protein PG994_010825 [Apiospora phragmitis]|uniref:Prefoldin subunit 1 n=1 Tax=Apiospora phragmitis TaxID=2905665 RepID=A0ABR1TR36_9PEZI
MSISNEALQKLVREIESQSIVAQQQIALVRTQQASKQREMRMAQLTRSEIASLPKDTGVYEGVGKIITSLESQREAGEPDHECAEGGEGLGKKLTSLEITQKNSKEHIDRMLRGSAAAAS